MHFSGFTVSSACTHKVIVYTNDVSKLMEWNFMILLDNVVIIIIVIFMWLFFILFIQLYCLQIIWTKLAPVVQRVDSAIHWMMQIILIAVIHCVVIYSVNSVIHPLNTLCFCSISLLNYNYYYLCLNLFIHPSTIFS